MKITPFLGLKKPDYENVVDISILDEDMDILDEAIKELNKGWAEISRKVYYPDETSTATVINITVSGLASLTAYPPSLRLTIVPTESSPAGTGKTININGWGAKPYYKPNTTTAPKTTAGKAMDIWLSDDGANFFFKASAEGNAMPSQVLESTFSNDDDIGIPGTMPNNGALTITPGATAKTIPLGYHNGSGKVEGDADLIPANIIKGKNIFGVVGTADIVPNLAASTEKYIVIFGPNGHTTTTEWETVVSINVNMACLLECDIWGSYDGYFNYVYYQFFLGSTALTAELGGITGGAPDNVSLQVPGAGTLIIKLKAYGGHDSNLPGTVTKVRLYAKIT